MVVLAWLVCFALTYVGGSRVYIDATVDDDVGEAIQSQSDESEGFAQVHGIGEGTSLGKPGKGGTGSGLESGIGKGGFLRVGKGSTASGRAPPQPRAPAFTTPGRVPSQPRVPAIVPGQGRNEPSLANSKRIICPFLSTLVNEGVLPVQAEYSNQSLFDISVRAGLPPSQVMAHVSSNFENQPTGKQDLFNMEGAPNEHVRSTGINDCKTTFTNCVIDQIPQSCEATKTATCIVPNEEVFNAFFEAADKNRDGILTREELTQVSDIAVEGKLPPIVDRNPIGGGTLKESHLLLFEVFGNPQEPTAKRSITKIAFRTVAIDRKFPTYFKFPAAAPPGAIRSVYT